MRVQGLDPTTVTWWANDIDRSRGVVRRQRDLWDLGPARGDPAAATGC